MTQKPPETDKNSHLKITNPSPWINRFATLAPKNGLILDLACGGGRHGRLFLELGYSVVFMDKSVDAVSDLSAQNGVEIIEGDLEDSSAPFSGDGILAGHRFDGIVVSNYLHRPLFPSLLSALNPGGLFLYETFARGNEVFNRPRNPSHLLKSGELLEIVSGKLQVIAYEHGLIDKQPPIGVKQRIAAIKDLEASEREDHQPTPHSLYPAERER